MFEWPLWHLRSFFAKRRLCKPKARPCCLKPENLEPHQVRPDLTVARCKSCGSRHFELTINPGGVFAEGAEL